MLIIIFLLLQLHLAAGDHSAIINTCVRLGDAAEGGDSHLWTQALQYFGAQRTDCTQQVGLRCRVRGFSLPVRSFTCG